MMTKLTKSEEAALREPYDLNNILFEELVCRLVEAAQMGDHDRVKKLRVEIVKAYEGRNTTIFKLMKAKMKDA